MIMVLSEDLLQHYAPTYHSTMPVTLRPGLETYGFARGFGFRMSARMVSELRSSRAAQWFRSHEFGRPRSTE